MRHVTIPTTPLEQIPKTVQVIGKTIRDGTTNPSIRLHTAQLVTKAPRKNYLAQTKIIFDDILKNWRYVFDPVGRETVVGSGLAAWKLVHGGKGNRLGFGDCDDVTALSGAMLQSVGFPARVVTVTMPGRSSDSHVYIETKIPSLGWMPFDPVAYPNLKFGCEPPSIKKTRWDLNGKILSITGDHPGQSLNGVDEMYNQQGQRGEAWEQTPLEALGLAGKDSETMPDRWETAGLNGFGSYADNLGIIDGYSMNGFAEVELDGDEMVMTPIIEVDPANFSYLKKYGKPYQGMQGLGEDGATYSYVPSEDGLSGIWSRIKKGSRKVRRRIKKRARKIIKKIPGGKYALRFARKAKRVALKVVKPVLRKIAKYAKYIAPIAAIIPGIGPAITAGLIATGKVAQIASKMGVFQSKKTGKLKFKNPQQKRRFQLVMQRESRRLKPMRIKPLRMRRVARGY